MDVHEKLYRELAVKYDMPVNQIRAICRTPFKLLVDVIRSGTRKSVRFPYFGTFKVKERRAAYIDSLNASRKQ